MSYVHSTPGRLRIRVARLRSCPGEAGRLRGRLLAVPGIRAVEVNTLIGSVLIRYDCTLLSAEDVWTKLSEMRCVPSPVAPLSGGVGADADKALADATSKVSGRLVEMLAEKIAEATVMAVLGAII